MINKTITLLFVVTLLGTCPNERVKKNHNRSKQSTPVQTTTSRTTKSSVNQTKKQKKQNINWIEKELHGITFKIPENFKSLRGNPNNRSYFSDKNKLGFTINFEKLPQGNENKTLYELAPDIKEFGEMINKGIRQKFSDYKLIKSLHWKLDNLNAIKLIQESKKVSGDGTLITNTTFFIIYNSSFALD